MSFLICLVVATILAFAGKQFIKKHGTILYVVAALISLCVIVGTAMGVSGQLPQFVRTVLWAPFAWGGFATAIFVLVMFAGAVPQGSVVQKTLMPIRAELSIIASILTLGHNLSAGQTYFVFLFTEPSKLQGTQLMATICSLIMLCIMIPLFITSFPSVRRKMQGTTWKKLQRCAYAFYALIYVHVLLLYVPKAQLGHTSAIFDVVVFSVIFMAYGVMRIRKAMKNSTGAVKTVPVVAAVAVCAVVAVLSMPKTNMEVSALSAENVSEESTEQNEKEIDPSTDTEQEVKEDEKESDSSKEDDATKEEEKSSDPEEKDKNKEKDKSEQSKVDKKTTKEEKKKEEPAQSKKENVPEAKPAAKEKSAPAQTPAPTPTPTPAPEPAPAPEPEPPAVTYQYQNGTFTGSGSGYEGNITVNVTIQNDVITGISVASHGEDEPFWSNAQAVISSILSAQSTNVSAVSGATYSSNGIKAAVAAALSSAKN